MDTYLEFRVPVRWDAEWFYQLREAMKSAGIPTKWQRRGSFPITMMFIKDDVQTEALNHAFDRCLDEGLAPSLTLDKLNAFVTKSGKEIIVNLTSSQPSSRFTNLVEMLRYQASNLDAKIESEFKLHITLGRIDTASTSLEDVEKVVAGIQIPPFTLCLTDAEYRYYRGDMIGEWKLSVDCQRGSKWQ